ncbi:class I SAM-dependent methyltransferase [Halorussus ruber]|uniref:class I SAM-dependent methyltransferase n=1 Tax=Halorussus ruber TaxID=1126238 RepID=UPI001092F4E7|nr:class I SAM-dependent methyltransferase [Halorussus ruber]
MGDDENESNRSTPPPSTVAEGYDLLAERAREADGDLHRADSPWGDSHFQRHYSWPATERVLPDVSDERVLLAGCGRGDHVEWFRERGAGVVGVDASAEAIRTARERFGDVAAFSVADITDSLDFEAGAFDLVFSNLVLSHVEEWTPVFEEFHRLLSPDGRLVFTTVHPEYLRAGTDANYYEVAEFSNSWPGVEIPTFYRPIGAIVGALLGADYRLDAFEEPKPEPEFRDHYPDRYEAAMDAPEILVVRARRG